MILVTGATGQLGRQVIDILRQKIAPSEIVACVRQPGKATELAAAGIEVRQADYSDQAAMVRALRGVDRVFMVSTTGPQVVAEHRSALAAAVEAGVPHLVYTSGILAPGTLTGAVHGQTEAAIRASGINYTVLRNSLYAEVLAREVLSAITTGALTSPAGDGRVGAVTRRDCAAAAAAVLTSAGHDGQTYEITGPELITWQQLADIASEIAGRNIPYRPEELPEPIAAASVIMADYYAAIGRGGFDVLSDAVLNITGQAPESVTEFIRTSLQTLQHQD